MPNSQLQFWGSLLSAAISVLTAELIGRNIAKTGGTPASGRTAALCYASTALIGAVLAIDAGATGFVALNAYWLYRQLANARSAQSQARVSLSTDHLLNRKDKP